MLYILLHAGLSVSSSGLPHAERWPHTTSAPCKSSDTSAKCDLAEHNSSISQSL